MKKILSTIAILYIVAMMSTATTTTPDTIPPFIPDPIETYAESAQEPQKAHSLTKRLNYTTLFANAPKSSPCAEIEAPAEETEKTIEEEPVKMLMLATAYSSDPAENGEWGAVDCRYGQPLPEDAIAANLTQLPYGTRVYIEGFGERVVVDTASQKTISRREAEAETKGAAGWIDIYYGDDKQGALKWGVQIVEVIVLEWGDVK